MATLVVWLSVLDARSGITRNVSTFQTQSTLNPQLYGLVMHVLTICSYAYLSSACISIMHDMNLVYRYCTSGNENRDWLKLFLYTVTCHTAPHKALNI